MRNIAWDCHASSIRVAWLRQFTFMQLLHSPPLSATQNIILCYGRALPYIHVVCAMSVDWKFDGRGTCASPPPRLAPLDIVRAQRACVLRGPGNDRSSHTPGIWPDRMREMHRQREKERDWQTSATTVVTFMTYEKHFEELRRLLAAEGERMMKVQRVPPPLITSTNLSLYGVCQTAVFILFAKTRK